MEETEAVVSLTAIAQPMRLRVFRELVVAGGEGMTPGVLSEQMGIPPATLSFHLKELLRAGMVSQERASRNLIYRANFERMNALLGYLMDNCCQGQACSPSSNTCKPSRPASSTPNRRTHHEAVSRPRSRP